LSLPRKDSRAAQLGASYDLPSLSPTLQRLNDLKTIQIPGIITLRALQNFEDQNAEEDIASCYFLMSQVYAAFGNAGQAAFYTSNEYWPVIKNSRAKENQQLSADYGHPAYQNRKKDALLTQQQRLESASRTIQLLFGGLAGLTRDSGLLPRIPAKTQKPAAQPTSRN